MIPEHKDCNMIIGLLIYKVIKEQIKYKLLLFGVHHLNCGSYPVSNYSIERVMNNLVILFLDMKWTKLI